MYVYVLLIIAVQLLLSKHDTTVDMRAIYINNWIADRLFAKQPASEATA